MTPKTLPKGKTIFYPWLMDEGMNNSGTTYSGTTNLETVGRTLTLFPDSISTSGHGTVVTVLLG